MTTDRTVGKVQVNEVDSCPGQVAPRPLEFAASNCGEVGDFGTGRFSVGHCNDYNRKLMSDSPGVNEAARAERLIVWVGCDDYERSCGRRPRRRLQDGPVTFRCTRLRRIESAASRRDVVHVPLENSDVSFGRAHTVPLFPKEL